MDSQNKDIVERLRGSPRDTAIGRLDHEAADEIEALRRQRSERRFVMTDLPLAEIDQIARQQDELMEQARLLGISAERECALRGEVERLKRHRDALVKAIENLENQKGRHNTEIAYGRLMEALAKVKGE